MTSGQTRRRVLRGMLGGSAVTVALPFLNCFLNGNGTALANGTALPVRFGTWFWGLGMNSQIWVPKKVGADYELGEELQALKGLQQHVNLYSNFNVATDGKPTLCHFTGNIALRTGRVPATRTDLTAETIDVTAADVIGSSTRFRALGFAATGDAKDSQSFRSGDAVNPPFTAVTEAYQAIFGPEFQDPNAPDWKPNPSVMLRQSVLSAVREDMASLVKTVGAEDKARLDQHMTAIRELEQRVALQLERPPRAEACSVPSAPDKDVALGTDSELVKARHKAMSTLLALAVACDQTRVFNMVYSAAAANTHKLGAPLTHHLCTHEEQSDPKAGYQVMHSWFVREAMECWAQLVGALAAVPEGEGTLLDRTIVFANTDSSIARTHSIQGVPMMTAGRAGGRIKSGLHVDGKGEMGTRLGLTLLQAVGLSVNEWGTGLYESLEATERDSCLVNLFGCPPILSDQGACSMASIRTVFLASVCAALVGISHGAFAEQTGPQLPAGVQIRISDEGPVLTDAKGLTLYVLTRDKKPNQSSCKNEKDKTATSANTGVVYPVPGAENERTCLEKWPPLQAAAGSKPFDEWAVIHRDDGIDQWAYKGHALYRSIKDHKPGDVFGAGRAGKANVNAGAIFLVRMGQPQGIDVRKNPLGIAFTTAGGDLLYTFDGDKAGRTPTCRGDCLVLRQPVPAPALAVRDGDWSPVVRDDGSKQWAYRGKPVYFSAVDSDFQSTAGGHWHPVVIKPAPTPPPGITVQESVSGPLYADVKGQTLYLFTCQEETYDRLSCDDVGDNPVYYFAQCGGPEKCAAMWKPVLAASNASGNETWSVVTINPTNPVLPVAADGGVRVWAFRGKPLYTCTCSTTPGDIAGLFRIAAWYSGR